MYIIIMHHQQQKPTQVWAQYEMALRVIKDVSNPGRDFIADVVSRESRSTRHT